ncbi:MAG: hypothetical protein GXY28_07245, partial [Bacteriovoracaceae bacterium]|nr:hypothetical protein [Bacteriovoracaceae bacterium]
MKGRDVADEIFERLGMGVIRLDRGLSIIHVNTPARIMLQQPEGDMRGRALRKVLPGTMSQEFYGAAGRAV